MTIIGMFNMSIMATIFIALVTVLVGIWRRRARARAAAQAPVPATAWQRELAEDRALGPAVVRPEAQYAEANRRARDVGLLAVLEMRMTRDAPWEECSRHVPLFESSPEVRAPGGVEYRVRFALDERSA